MKIYHEMWYVIFDGWKIPVPIFSYKEPMKNANIVQKCVSVTFLRHAGLSVKISIIFNEISNIKFSMIICQILMSCSGCTFTILKMPSLSKQCNTYMTFLSKGIWHWKWIRRLNEVFITNFDQYVNGQSVVVDSYEWQIKVVFGSVILLHLSLIWINNTTLTIYILVKVG